MESILTSSVLLDPELQPRVGGLDASHVQTLQECPQSWPPLTVVQQGSGYCLVDGFHRFAAAQNLGLTSLTVEVVPSPADHDLRALAFELNARHGRPLSLDDRRAEAGRLLHQSPQIANMEVLAAEGLSPSTVQAIRERLERAQNIASTAERVGSGGATYAVTPTRSPGELPPASFAEAFTDTVGRIFTPPERVAQRKIAGYLQRLAVALEDLDNLDGWETGDDAAQACVLVLGAERARDLAARLGWASSAVLDVATLLGYSDTGATQ